MSLTQAEEVFASVHEQAINDFLQAFASDRPRLFAYGSPAFTPVTTISQTRIDAIAFPGVAGGIEWQVRIDTPRIDLYKQTDPLPPELSLDPGRFSMRLGAELCLDCRRLTIDPRPPKIPKERELHDERGADHRQPIDVRDDKWGKHPLREVTCCKLEVFVVGHIERVAATTGEDAITFAVDAVEIVDIGPDELESLLECLLFMILQAVLSTIRIPLRALRAGAFQLALTVGPLVEDDQIKVRGLF